MPDANGQDHIAIAGSQLGGDGQQQVIRLPPVGNCMRRQAAYASQEPSIRKDLVAVVDAGDKQRERRMHRRKFYGLSKPRLVSASSFELLGAVQFSRYPERVIKAPQVPGWFDFIEKRPRHVE